MEIETEVAITPRQASDLYKLFCTNPFYSNLEEDNLTYGWRNFKCGTEMPLFAYTDGELRISLTNFRRLPKEVHGEIIKILTKTRVLEALEDLDIKI